MQNSCFSHSANLSCKVQVEFNEGSVFTSGNESIYGKTN